MSVLAARETTLESINHVIDVRYLTVISFSILLYDIFVTFGDELELVWKRKWTLVTSAYVVNRYGTCIFVLYFITGVLIPTVNLSTEWRSAESTVVLDALVETCGNGIVLYELIKLWDTKRSLSWLMATGYIVMHGITLIFVGLQAHQLQGNVAFAALENFRTCTTFVKESALIGIYAPAVALDVYAFVLLFLNALSRPRSSSQRLLDLLYKDGLLFFFTTFSMRMLCLVFSIAAPPSLAVAGLISPCAIVSTAVSRLYLRLQRRHLERSTERTSGLKIWFDDEDDDDGGEEGAHIYKPSSFLP